MRTGRMNNPAAKLTREVRLTAELGFDYLELTVEPPSARSDLIRPKDLARLLGDLGLGVVGHTAFYLPIADPFPRVRQAAVDQLKADLEVLAAVGCDRATVHPHASVSIGYAEDDRLKRQAESFAALVEHGKAVGISVLLENLDGFIGDPERLKRCIFDEVPDLGFTLDLGHAALGVGENRTPRLLELLGDRLAHVHVSDNNGRQDLHQPLGAGRVGVKSLLEAVKATGYDGGITVEVFGVREEYLRLSRELLWRWWNGT